MYLGPEVYIATILYRMNLSLCSHDPHW